MFMQELLSAVFDTAHDNGGPTLLGQKIGVSPRILANKVNPKQQHNQLTLIEALRIQEITGDHRILRAMARALGYVLVPIDRPAPSDVELLTLYANWQAANGDTYHAIAHAFRDRRIDRSAYREVERRFFDGAAAGLSFVQRMEGLVQ